MTTNNLPWDRSRTKEWERKSVLNMIRKLGELGLGKTEGKAERKSYTRREGEEGKWLKVGGCFQGTTQDGV